jgi:hypothetical protein
MGAGNVVRAGFFYRRCRAGYATGGLFCQRMKGRYYSRAAAKARLARTALLPLSALLSRSS